MRAIDTTNCYTTIADADSYFGVRVITQIWTNAGDDDKTRALLQATQIIDQLNFYCDKTDPDQALEFPRNDNTVIPESIKLATCEIAISLLEGINPELEYTNLDVTSQTFANVKTTYDRRNPPQHLLAGVPSITAWRYLLPYLKDPRTIVLSRVN